MYIEWHSMENHKRSRKNIDGSSFFFLRNRLVEDCWGWGGVKFDRVNHRKGPQNVKFQVHCRVKIHQKYEENHEKILKPW